MRMTLAQNTPASSPVDAAAQFGVRTRRIGARLRDPGRRQRLRARRRLDLPGQGQRQGDGYGHGRLAGARRSGPCSGARPRSPGWGRGRRGVAGRLPMRRIPGVSGATARPSIETGMHAVLLAQAKVRWIAHTHPTPSTAVLCSAQAEQSTAAGAGYPCTGVCGRGWEHGRGPGDHGYGRQGGTGAGDHLACGGPCYLAAAELRRIASRTDEHYRQRALGLTAEEGERIGA